MMTPEKKEGIIADYKSGMSIYTISRKWHTHFYAVRELCKDIKCDRPGKGRPPKLTPDVVAQIERRRQTETVKQIAESLGVTRAYVYYLLSTVDN